MFLVVFLETTTVILSFVYKEVTWIISFLNSLESASNFEWFLMNTHGNIKSQAVTDDTVVTDSARLANCSHRVICAMLSGYAVFSAIRNSIHTLITKIS